MADNPQAFPTGGRVDIGAAFPASTYEPGMTLLDYFAGQALVAMSILNDGEYTGGDFERGRPERDAQYIASAAYRIAAAMLNERQSHGG